METQWSEILVPEGFPPCRYIVQVTLGDKNIAFERNVKQFDSLRAARLYACYLFYLRASLKIDGKRYWVLGVRIFDSRDERLPFLGRMEEEFLGGFHARAGCGDNLSQEQMFLGSAFFLGGGGGVLLWWGLSALACPSVLLWFAVGVWVVLALCFSLWFGFGD